MGMYQGSLDELCCLRGRPHMTHSQGTGHRCFWRQQIWAGLWRERQEWGDPNLFEAHSKEGTIMRGECRRTRLSYFIVLPCAGWGHKHSFTFYPQKVSARSTFNESISHISEFTLSSPRVNNKSVLAQPALCMVPPDQVLHGWTSRVSYWVK